ncbi:hypothetical protein SY85_11580 [Flavisolibacter tropicus]|uniref:LamG-like jellyroll fold domain-containing protein n=2 Tax=Flavisolibacter tropicus TaxID=1492898 RepID=A0A172TVP8_9BACT|nr:hypothetical protein SY85_11580 [Flavisolibacter tropicus]
MAAVVAAIGSCQKIDRPGLGEVVTDGGKGLPTGSLRFFTSFNKTDGPSARWNALDSISGNPALLYPVDYTDGINGKAFKGKDNEAVLYLNANDFDKASSFSIAFWIKNAAQSGRTEFLFSLVQPNFSWTNSAAFVLVENQTATNTTMKFGLKDQWLEGTFNKPMFDGSWHHMVYSYDNAAKKMTYYFDGQEVTGMTATQTNMNASVNFTGVTNLILGGWNKHAGQKGPTDDWVKSFTGSLDQFRMYDKALTATEALALYNSKL